MGFEGRTESSMTQCRMPAAGENFENFSTKNDVEEIGNKGKYQRQYFYEFTKWDLRAELYVL